MSFPAWRGVPLCWWRRVLYHHSSPSTPHPPFAWALLGVVNRALAVQDREWLPSFAYGTHVYLFNNTLLQSVIAIVLLDGCHVRLLSHSVNTHVRQREKGHQADEP